MFPPVTPSFYWKLPADNGIKILNFFMDRFNGILNNFLQEFTHREDF